MSEWEEFKTDQGEVYYHNKRTNKTTWDKPAGFGAPAASKKTPAVSTTTSTTTTTITKPVVTAAAQMTTAKPQAAQEDTDVKKIAGTTWEKIKAPDGDFYWHDTATGTTTWDEPSDCKGVRTAAAAAVAAAAAAAAVVKKPAPKAVLPSKPIVPVAAVANDAPPRQPLWQPVKTDEGEEYFHNTQTDETTWDKPQALKDYERALTDYNRRKFAPRSKPQPQPQPKSIAPKPQPRKSRFADAPPPRVARQQAPPRSAAPRPANNNNNNNNNFRQPIVKTVQLAAISAPQQPAIIKTTWEAVRTTDGDTYFHNRETGLTTWDEPDEMRRIREANEARRGQQQQAPRNSIAAPVKPAPVVAPKPVVNAAAAASEWQEFKTDSGEPYYHNTRTNQTVWDKPAALMQPSPVNGKSAPPQPTDRRSKSPQRRDAARRRSRSPRKARRSRSRSRSRRRSRRSRSRERSRHRDNHRRTARRSRSPRRNDTRRNSPPKRAGNKPKSPAPPAAAVSGRKSYPLVPLGKTTMVRIDINQSAEEVRRFLQSTAVLKKLTDHFSITIQVKGVWIDTAKGKRGPAGQHPLHILIKSNDRESVSKARQFIEGQLDNDPRPFEAFMADNSRPHVVLDINKSNKDSRAQLLNPDVRRALTIDLGVETTCELKIVGQFVPQGEVLRHGVHPLGLEIAGLDLAMVNKVREHIHLRIIEFEHNRRPFLTDHEVIGHFGQKHAVVAPAPVAHRGSFEEVPMEIDDEGHRGHPMPPPRPQHEMRAPPPRHDARHMAPHHPPPPQGGRGRSPPREPRYRHNPPPPPPTRRDNRDRSPPPAPRGEFRGGGRSRSPPRDRRASPPRSDFVRRGPPPQSRRRNSPPRRQARR